MNYILNLASEIQIHDSFLEEEISLQQIGLRYIGQGVLNTKYYFNAIAELSQRKLIPEFKEHHASIDILLSSESSNQIFYISGTKAKADDKAKIGFYDGTIACYEKDEVQDALDEAEKLQSLGYLAALLEEKEVKNHDYILMSLEENEDDEDDFHNTHTPEGPKPLPETSLI